MFVPMIIGDVVELAQKNPSLLPMVLPATGVGMGSQTYERGKEESTFIPQKYDPWKFQGGPLF
jgi:hypothetical protein